MKFNKHISIKSQTLKNKLQERYTSTLKTKTMLKVAKDLKLWRDREERACKSAPAHGLEASIVFFDSTHVGLSIIQYNPNLKPSRLCV